MEEKVRDIKQDIINVIPKWQKIMHMERFDMTLKWEVKAEGAKAECVVIYPYLSAELRFDLKAIEKDCETFADVERLVVHELVHLLTDPFYVKANRRYVGVDELTDERELLTDSIAQIIYAQQQYH